MQIINHEVNLDKAILKHNITSYFSDLNKLRSGIKLVKFSKNTFIYDEDEHKKYVYFLVSGQLNIYANSANGKRVLIRCCNEFIFIGDMELMGYSEPSNTIQTKTECMCIGIDISAMRGALLEDKKFLQFLCKSLADKLAFLGTAESTKQLHTASQNLVEYILCSSENKGYFKDNLRKVAEVFGISERHLYRILSNLVDKNILQRSKRGYEIVDTEALRLLADQDNFR